MKNMISIKDLTADEIRFLMDFSERVKAHPEVYRKKLRGKTLGLIFEKASTRTWASFHVGMVQLGGDALYLGPQDIAMGKREEVRDIARVMSSYVDASVLRTFSHRTIAEYAAYSMKPVINGLSNFSHPCQGLTDLFTVREHFGKDNLPKLKIAYVGDANNVFNSLLFASAKMGLTFGFATPREYAPGRTVMRTAREFAKRSKAKISGGFKPKEAVKGADVIYTDVWVSMGDKMDPAEKKKAFKIYQVNQKLLKYASEEVKVMHCLPAHRGEEITNQVVEGSHSLIFEQAENRLHVQKAILLYLLTDVGMELKKES